MPVVSKKEMKKRLLIKQTLNEMNKQIQKLEKQKEAYINAAKEAKQKGLTSQYNLAISGLRMTMAQQKRIAAMKLNFEITSQMKDTMGMTAEFLKGMEILSKDMVKLTKEKDFERVEKSFNEAMVAAEMSSERMENLLEGTQSSFETSSTMSEDDNKEIDDMIENEVGLSVSSDSVSQADIDKELSDLQKKMGI